MSKHICQIENVFPNILIALYIWYYAILEEVLVHCLKICGPIEICLILIIFCTRYAFNYVPFLSFIQANIMSLQKDKVLYQYCSWYFGQNSIFAEYRFRPKRKNHFSVEHYGRRLRHVQHTRTLTTRTDTLFVAASPDLPNLQPEGDGPK